MRTQRRVLATVFAVSLIAAVAVPAAAQPGGGVSAQAAALGGGSRCTRPQFRRSANRLADQGYDVVSIEQVQGGVRVVLVLYPWQRKALEKQGIDLDALDQHRGRDRDQARQAAGGRRIQGVPALRRARTASAPTSTRSLPPIPTC